MASTSRGRQAASALFTHSGRACTRCTQGQSSLLAPAPISRRAYSAAAASAEISPDNTSTPTATAASFSSSPLQKNPSVVVSHPGYRIRAGLLLSRAPLLTREPTPFESAYYLYQKRLNERLAGSFRRNVYFKPDTTPAFDWRLQLRDRRGTPARDIGIYQGGKGGRGRGGAWAWNDELTLDDPLAQELTQPDRLRERILSDADMRVSEDGERLADADRVHVERPQPRLTAADAAQDTTRLDRKLDRTLYLVVRGGGAGGKGTDAAWAFPTVDVRTDENLHESAARALESAAGVDMNTWIVGRVPVAHVIRSAPDSKDPQDGEKIFFLKGRIMAGQANLANNKLGLSEFKWLTKEELAEALPPYYFSSVKNALPGR